MTVFISPARVTLALALIVLSLTLMGIVREYCEHIIGAGPHVMKVVDKFDLNSEDNTVPVWYQTSALLLSSLMLAAIASAKKRAQADKFAGYWDVMSLVFLFLSFDESVVVHEHLGYLITYPLIDYLCLGRGGIFASGWVMVGGILSLIFAVSYLKFLYHLPPGTRRAFIIAGAVYVSGALGMEMTGWYYRDSVGDLSITHDFTYGMFVVIEEFLEMAGIVIFLNGLTSYLVSSDGVVGVAANDAVTHPPAAPSPWT